MIEHEVALICTKDDLITKILNISKGELWKIEESEKRREFMQSFFNYDVPTDLRKIIFGN